MIAAHIILAVLWIMFCLLHSLFAAAWFKRIMENILASRFKWYRIYYNSFAAISFILIIIYQLFIISPVLYKTNFTTGITGGVIALSGLIIMLRCIVRYFPRLSGLHATVNERQGVLLQDGLHKIVRHPLYLGTFIFIWGIFIILPYLSLLICNSIITIYTLMGIRLEEKKLEKEFGEAYKVYKQQVPMIIPFT